MLSVVHRFDDGSAVSPSNAIIWRNTAHHMKIKITLPGSHHVTGSGLPAFNGDIQVKIINEKYSDSRYSDLNLTNVVEFCGFAIAKVGKNIPCVHPVRDIEHVPVGGADVKNNTDGDEHKKFSAVKISNLCYMRTVDDKEEDMVSLNIAFS